MGKAPLILQYLHDHARLICDRRNEKDGSGTWRITPITDDQRHNIIFHYGTSEKFQDFFSNNPAAIAEPEKVVDSPTLNYCEINLKGLERREMMRMTEKKATGKSRITLKRGPTVDSKTKNGIFCNGIEAIRVTEEKKPSVLEMRKYENMDRDYSIVYPDIPVPVRNPSPSTSSIYLAVSDLDEYSSSDYEKDLFKTPDDFILAQYHHQCDLERCDDNWFDNTANFTQSQQQRSDGFRDHYRRFNSQR